jgi:YbbR domain-containing protein
MEKKNSGAIVIRVVLSILVAIAIWLYVDIGQQTTVRTVVRNIPVEFSGENGILADRNLMLLSGYDTTIDLWLEGPRTTLWKLDKSKIRIVANTAGITETGIQSLAYDVIYPDNVSRTNIKVEKASAYSITVTVGELSTKEIPVYCDVTGQVADGFFTETVQLDPATLLLRGQRDDLLNVSYAKIVMVADGLEKTMVQGIAYTLYDYNDIPLETSSIRTDTKMIQATLPVKTTKSIPLQLNYVEAPGSTIATMKSTIVPKSVTLSGDKDVLADIESIYLDTIYLQDLAPYQTFEYELNAPEGTALPEGVEKATATIVVNGVSERTLTVTDILFTNVMDGYTATAVTEGLDVVVRGLSADVEAMLPEDIVVTASLDTILTAGDYTVPVEITLPKYPNVGAKGKYQIIVNLSVTPEPEPEPDVQNPDGAGGHNG